MGFRLWEFRVWGLGFRVIPGSLLTVGVLKWEFRTLGVPYFGVLTIRILLFRVHYVVWAQVVLRAEDLGLGFHRVVLSGFSMCAGFSQDFCPEP